MVCPGLHSLLVGLRLTAAPDDGAPTLDYRVVNTDKRLSLISLDVAGSGWTGSVDSLFLRPADASP